MKKTIFGIAILFMLVVSAFATYQPEETSLPPTITFDDPEYDESHRVVTYGSAYYYDTADAFCSHLELGGQAGFQVASGTVDGTYAWYQTSWYIGHDEGGKIFDSITCFTS